VGRTGPTTGCELIERYNVALIQALLIKATGLTVRLAQPPPKHLRALFRYLKFFQLMYRVHAPNREEVVVTVDGPESLLRQSTRYGMQLATFLPAVLQQPGAWSMEAEVLWGRKRKLRKTLRLDHSQGLRSHYQQRGTWRSNSEEWFETRFAEVAPEWKLGPGRLIDMGQQQVLVPDFTFEKDGRVAHLDIVGYWRKGYLRKRLAETPDNVVLAVSRRLTGDKTALPKTLQRQVVEFAEMIPAGKVRDRLEEVAR
jgi:predicted nuclease of restriction endonuclease-like RecB superfamily